MQETEEKQLDSWGGKILWRRVWQPTPVFLPEESMIHVLISFVHVSIGLSLLTEEWEFYRGANSLFNIGAINTFSQFFFEKYKF